MDLTGKILFKVKLDNQIKKILIHNDDLNYNELLLMMQRIFSDKIKPNDEFTIKYTDEENDLITLSDDTDLSLAINNSKILKLTLYVNDKEEKAEDIKASEIISELQTIRRGIDQFLDKFERYLRLDKAPVKTEEAFKVENDTKPSLQTTSISSSSSVLPSEIHKEFDPLNKSHESQKLYQNKKLDNSRAQTPDSISSQVESSPRPKQLSNMNLQQQQHPSHMGAMIPPPTSFEKPTYQQEAHLGQYQHPTQQNMPSQLLPPQQQQQQQQQYPGYNPQQQQQPQPVQQPQPAQQPGQFYQPQTASKQQGYMGQQYATAQTNIQQPSQDPLSQQQMYQQQQQQQFNPSQIPQAGMNQPHASMIPPSNMPAGSAAPNPYMPPMGSAGNPYAKPMTLARPPSTTIYQQGYK